MNSDGRKVIASLEIIGGVTGPVIVLVENGRRGCPIDTVPIAAILIGLYLLSLFAGVMLWRDQRVGYIASVVIQLVQLPKLIGRNYVFMMSFGFDVAPTFTTIPEQKAFMLSVNVRMGADHVLVLDPPPGAPYGWGISIVSFIALCMLVTGRAANRPRDLGNAQAESATPTTSLPRYPGGYH
jgi:hypothetical protein